MADFEKGILSKTALLVLIFIFLHIPATAVTPSPAIKDSVADKFTPSIGQEKTYADFINQKIKTNKEWLLNSDPHTWAFTNFQPASQEMGGYGGEYAGQFLDAICMEWAYTGDTALQTKMNSIVSTLLSCQRPDGYLGNYLDTSRWKCWDVWNQSKSLIGLLSHYEVSGSEASLAACQKEGDLLCHVYLDSTVDINITNIAYSPANWFANIAILESMARLYRYTGNQRYLDFCNFVINSMEQKANGCKMISKFINNIGGGSIQRRDFKAYETLIILNGLLELYRITGHSDFFNACTSAWRDLKNNKLSVNGTVDRGEWFPVDHSVNDNGGSEVDVVVTWQQFNLNLFNMTGEPRYAAELERITFNALPAAIDPRTGTGYYFVGLSGPGKAKNNGMYGFPRAMARISRYMAGAIHNNPTVILYTPGLYHIPMQTGADTLSANLLVETDYPYSGNIKITVTPSSSHNFTVLLYVPEWCAQYTAKVESDEYVGLKGEFLSITRNWSAGDIITIQMDMTWQQISAGSLFPGKVAVKRGPQLMSFDASIDPKTFTLPPQWIGTQLYTDKYQTCCMVPYSEAGQLASGPFFNFYTIADSIQPPSASTKNEVWFVELNHPALTLSPNPFNQAISIHVSGFKNGAEVRILDINGRMVENLTPAFPAGLQKMTTRRTSWNASNHAPGVYVISVKHDNVELKRKAILIK